MIEQSYIDVVFDGPPGPESGRFVEVEDVEGHSIDAGEWVRRHDCYWALRIELLSLAGQPATPQGVLASD